MTPQFPAHLPRVALIERLPGGLGSPAVHHYVGGRRATRDEFDAIRRSAVGFEACEHASTNGVPSFYCTAVLPAPPAA